MEPGNFSIADDDSEVQTALRNFQVKNTPKDPFSQIAKPTLFWVFGSLSDIQKFRRKQKEEKSFNNGSSVAQRTREQTIKINLQKTARTLDFCAVKMQKIKRCLVICLTSVQGQLLASKMTRQELVQAYCPKFRQPRKPHATSTQMSHNCKAGPRSSMYCQYSSITVLAEGGASIASTLTVYLIPPNNVAETHRNVGWKSIEGT